MIKLSLRYLIRNKTQTLTVMIGVILASVLLFSVGILFSSFRECLIEKVTENNDFHVRIKSDFEISDDSILSIQFKDGENFIKFKNIYDTYENTDRICEDISCKKIVYNIKLLSLYGIGDNNYLDLFKELLVIIVLVLSVSVFFIIYNSFQISVNKKRRDITLFKLIGISNNQIYIVFLFEGIICGFLGIVLGFIFSLVFNAGISGLINHLLTEALGGKMKVCLFMPFILIPLFFMIVIILLSVVLPLFKIKKYKAMELFQNNNLVDMEKSRFKNFIIDYAYINYKRGKRKYRCLIICVFIIIILFNSFARLTNYTVEILDEYLDIPKFDVSVVTNMVDYDKLDGLADDLKSKEVNVFRSCTKQTSILKEKYNQGYQKTSEVFITDLGETEVINLAKETILDNNKMSKISYEIFNNLDGITLDNNVKIDGIKLVDDVPFGFDNMLIKGRIILNLNEDKFDEVCPVFDGNAFIKTDESRLDEKITDYVKKENFGEVIYTNVKKGYELINNFALLIKLFMFLCVGLVVVISVFTIINIISANINMRKREFASLKAIGLTNFKISLCLFIEGLIISGKGVLYSFPFVLMISNGLYRNIGMFFEVSVDVFDYGLFCISFVFCFLIIFICMYISHLHLYKKSLIENIKSNFL